MPLLTFEGVEVDIPATLAGISFSFAAGRLSIQCRNFSGDVVLSKPSSPQLAVAPASSVQAVVPTLDSNSNKKRPIDLSASDDDETDSFVSSAGAQRSQSAKRPRPGFLNDAEESMLLAQLDPSGSVASSQQSLVARRSLSSLGRSEEDEHSDSGDETGSKGKETMRSGRDSTVNATAGVMTAFLSQSEGKRKGGSKVSPAVKRATSKKGKKSKDPSLIFPEPKASTPHTATPESQPNKRGRTKKSPTASPVAPSASSSPAAASKSTATVDAKQTVNGKWTTTETTGTTPAERWGHTATAISDDRIVVYGGANDDERTLGDLHVFDLKAHKWTMPINCESIPRMWHDAVYLEAKHLLLVFGGERTLADDQMDILSDIMVLDTECFLWYPPAIRGTPPTARSGHTCTVLGNEIVVFGGSRGRSRQSSVHILDSDEWEWKTVKIEGKPPSARTYHSAVTVGSSVVFFGGNDSTKCFNSVHVLAKQPGAGNGATWTWFHPCVVGTPPQARTGHSATLVGDGKILIFGGWDPQGKAANTVVFGDAFLLDTTTWEWEEVALEGTASGGALPGRVGHRAVVDKAGHVHLFGGQNAVDQRLSVIHSLDLSGESPSLESLAAVPVSSGVVL